MIPVLRGLRGLRGVAALGFLVLNTMFWFVPILLLGTIRRLSPTPLRRVCGAGLAASLSGWVACAAAMAATLKVVRVRLEFAPESPPLRPDAWYLIVCNHQSWADILVLVFAFRGRTPPFKFFTKRALIWLPLIGVALWLLDFPYVRRHGSERLRANPALREQDERTVREVCAVIRERPTSVLNFLEGTRFTPAKRQAQDSPFQTLLKPKVGGLMLVRDGLADRLQAVVDATIHYPGGAPGFWDFLCGRCPENVVHVRALPPPEGDRDALREWVDALWAEKDARLQAAASAPPQPPA